MSLSTHFFSFGASGGGGPVPMLSGFHTSGWQGSYLTVPGSFDPDNAPEFVPLSRTGWDVASATVGTTPIQIAENAIILRRVRSPWPNQLTDVTTSTALSPTNAVALSTYTYSTDTYFGTPSASTFTSPLPVVRVITPDRSIVGDTIGGTVVPIEFVAFHRNGRQGRMVCAIVVTFSDGVNSVSVTLSSTSPSPRTSDKMPVTCFQVPETNISSLTNLTAGNNIITMNYKVYPWIGGLASVHDSSTVTVAREAGPRYWLRDVSRAATPPLAYVGGPGATDTTHAGWSTDAATAQAAPYASVQGAINDIAAAANTAVTGGYVDGCIVNVTDISNNGGNPWVLSSAATNRTQRLAGVIIQRAPGVPRANSVVSFGTASWRARMVTGLLSVAGTEGLVTFRDISIRRTGTLALQGESGNQTRFVFEDVDFDNGNVAASFRNQSHMYFYGMNATNMTGGSPLGANLTLQIRMMRGVANDFAQGSFEQWTTAGCDLTRVQNATMVDARLGAVNYCNRYRNINPSGSTFAGTTVALAAGERITNYMQFQNTIESIHTTMATPAIQLSADNPTNPGTFNCGFGFNSYTGYGSLGRHNVFYDENIGLPLRQHDLDWFVGEAPVQLNVKGDVFRADSTKTGNFAFVHGVDCRGTYEIFRPNSGLFSNEIQTHPGLNASMASSPDTPQAPYNNIFTNYQGTTGSGGTPTGGAGGTNFVPPTGSPLKNRTADTPLSHDLAGVSRGTGLTSTGAYV